MLGIPADVLTGLIFSFVRACVHYALFEDETYLKAQLGVLKTGIALFVLQGQAGQQGSGGMRDES